MQDQLPSPEHRPDGRKRGLDTEAGSVPRYLASVAATGVIAIVWAIAWETVFVVFHHADIAWVNLLIGFTMGMTVRKVWGIGGGVAMLNAVLLTLFSLGLGHLILFEHYALTQQAADDIGIAPSFRTVMGHLTTMHWVWCASALIGAIWIPLRRL